MAVAVALLKTVVIAQDQAALAAVAMAAVLFLKMTAARK